MDGYVRVSRVAGREGDSYISPSVQREAIQRWADYKGVQIGEWHVDEDWSGGTHERPGLERAVQRALKGETGGIVSWKIDRFSRQTEGGLRDLRRLQAKDARLAFVVEDVDTGTVYGRMIYTILLAVSEAFLENIKASWDTAKERAVKRGAYISRTPFGYQRRDDGTLEPHPDQAAVVAEAFRLAASDSLRAALDYLARTVPGRRWTATTVRRLLSGRAYLGETRGAGRVQADTHEPLVSRAVWEAAQTTPTSRRASASFPLSGLLRCGTCDSAMVGSRGGKGQRTYRCSATLSTRTGEKCARGATITAEHVEDHVRDVTRDLLTGLRVNVSDPDLDTLTLLERAVGDAEGELDAFAADVTLRRALGDRYHDHLQARVDTVDRARSEYRERAREAQARLALTSPDVVDNPKLFPLVLRSIFSSIVVTPGRGLAVGDRVRLVPVDADRPAGIFGSEGAQ